MSDQITAQKIIVSGVTMDPDMEIATEAHFHPDGTPVVPFAVSAAVTATAIGTAAKVVATAAPPANTFIAIQYTSGNSADSATVAFAGGSAIPIKLGGTASTGAKHTVAANGKVVYFYDGTTLNQLGVVS